MTKDDLIDIKIKKILADISKNEEGIETTSEDVMVKVKRKIFEQPLSKNGLLSTSIILEKAQNEPNFNLTVHEYEHSYLKKKISEKQLNEGIERINTNFPDCNASRIESKDLSFSIGCFKTKKIPATNLFKIDEIVKDLDKQAKSDIHKSTNFLK